MPFRCQQNWILFEFVFGGLEDFLRMFLFIQAKLFLGNFVFWMEWCWIYNLDKCNKSKNGRQKKKSYLSNLKLQIFFKSNYFYCTYLKVRQSRNNYFNTTFPPKKERTNSTLLLNMKSQVDLFSFGFWRHQKEISKLTDF